MSAVLGYFVTGIDGPRVAWALGPFRDHQDALDRVQEVRRVADDVDPRSVFAAWGTSGVRDERLLRPGLLNERMGYEVGEDGFVRL